MPAMMTQKKRSAKGAAAPKAKGSVAKASAARGVAKGLPKPVAKASAKGAVKEIAKEVAAPAADGRSLLISAPRTVGFRRGEGRVAGAGFCPLRRFFSAGAPGEGFSCDIALLASISGLLLLLRLFYLAFLTPYGLAPDEAQYWHWLAHNDWSFLTKPPLTTWAIGLSTFLLGDTLIGVKLFALLGQLAMPVIGFLMARDIAGRAAGWWAFALFSAVPLVAAGGLIMSPDALLVPLWMAALYSVIRALNAPSDPRALCWGRWLLIGAMIGLAGLAKYSAAFFYPLLFAYLLASKRGWDWLMKPQIWVSGLLALAFQLPVLLWNLRHDWVGVTHVLWQTDGGGDSRHGGMGTFFEFLGSQAGVLGPLVFALLLAAWVVSIRALDTRAPDAGRKGGRDQRIKLLVLFTLPLFAGFAAMTFHAKVQANWPVLGTLPALVLLAVWLGRDAGKAAAGEKPRRLGRFAAVAVALSALLSVLMMDVPFFRAVGIVPLSAKADPTKDLQGWPQLGSLLGVTLGALKDPVLVTSRYQTAAALAFHVPGKPEVLYENAENRRLNQYDLWAWPDLTNRIAVFVSERPTLPEAMHLRFDSCAPWHSLAVENHGEVVRRVSTWICWGYRKRL